MPLKHNCWTFFCLFIISLLVASCSNIEKENILSEADAEIGFGVAMSTNTRTIITDATQMGSFQVCGWRVPDNGISATRVFNGQTINYDSESGWTYAPEQYWILYNDYRFLAIYPTDVVGDLDENGVWTLADFDATRNIDLLADVIDIYSNETAVKNKVVFNMEHLLSKVSFSIKSESTDGVAIYLHSAKLYGVGQSGDYSSATEVWTHNGNVNADNTPHSVSYATKVRLSPTFQTFLSDLLLLPDTDITEATLEVIYSYGDEDPMYVVKRLPLYATELSEWSASEQYNYQLTISDFAISFEPKVTAWDEKMGNIITVE